jgi:hypothetical protein
MSKKGLGDVFAVILFLFTFSLITIIAVYIYQQYYAVASANSNLFGNISMQILESQTRTFQTLDYAFIFLVGAMLMSLYFSGYLLRTYPFFIVIAIILLIITGVISAILSNTFTAIKDALAVSGMPFTVLLAQNFPLIALFGGGLLMLGLYGKGSQEGGSYYG